jgi:ppGpp synthetase/RelA/SpoT-type nucleotidyltranferase
MFEPISNSEINKLGNFFRGPLIESTNEIKDIYFRYLIKLSVIQNNLVQEIGSQFSDVEISGRVKTVGTMREKLIRFPSMQLSTMDDAVGVRIIGEMDLEDQDKIAKRLLDQFSSNDLKDRREFPQFGYRAVHVIVKSNNLRAEIQIRTRLQAAWANAFEKLADTWGRQIRYGEDINSDAFIKKPERTKFLNDVRNFSLQEIAEFEKLSSEVYAHWKLEQQDYEINSIVKKPKNKIEVQIALEKRHFMEKKRKLIEEMQDYGNSLNDAIVELTVRSASFD